MVAIEGSVGLEVRPLDLGNAERPMLRAVKDGHREYHSPSRTNARRDMAGSVRWSRANLRGFDLALDIT